MAQPYVGEIRLFAGNFEPAGWMFCEGQIIPISEYETLFNLIGTTYGGDGQSTFALPDLRGRVPVHMGNGFVLGETGGVEQITLTVAQTPAHTHPLLGSQQPATTASPRDAVFAEAEADIYNDEGLVPTQTLHAPIVGAAGGSQPHTNFQPYLCVSHIISLFGLFPSPT